MDSFLAASIKEQVCTTIVAASAGSVMTSYPRALSKRVKLSVSAVFLAQPNVTMDTFSLGDMGSAQSVYFTKLCCNFHADDRVR